MKKENDLPASQTDISPIERELIPTVVQRDNILEFAYYNMEYSPIITIQALKKDRNGYLTCELGAHCLREGIITPAVRLRFNLSSIQDRNNISKFLTENALGVEGTWIQWTGILADVSQRLFVFYDEQGGETIFEEAAPHVKTISEVQIESVKWLWSPYIPYGKLTLLEGDPGIGKSWVCLAIATAISLGHGLPNQNELGSGPVLIASAEDGIADTIKPRLTQMGADQTSIRAIDGLFTLNDAGFQMLNDYMFDLVPVLVIIDPLVAYLSGDIDINKANQVRYATARLAALAEKYGSAILAVRHLTKGNNTKAIYRGLGSIDFTAAARSVLFVGQDPENETNRAIDHIKSNLSVKGEPIGYELRSDGFYWKQTTDLTYAKMTELSETPGAMDEARDFITEVLASGEVLASEILKESKDSGISSATLNRAKKALNVLVERRGEPGVKGGGKWYWKLPQKGH